MKNTKQAEANNEDHPGITPWNRLSPLPKKRQQRDHPTAVLFFPKTWFYDPLTAIQLRPTNPSKEPLREPPPQLYSIHPGFSNVLDVRMAL